MNRCQWNFSLRNMVASKKTVTELTPAIGYTLEAFACDSAVYRNAAAVAAHSDATRTMRICGLREAFVGCRCRRRNRDTTMSMRNAIR